MESCFCLALLVFFLLLLFKRGCDINKRIDVLEILTFATSMIIKVVIIDQSVVSRVEVSKNQTKKKTQISENNLIIGCLSSILDKKKKKS